MLWKFILFFLFRTKMANLKFGNIIIDISSVLNLFGINQYINSENEFYDEYYKQSRGIDLIKLMQKDYDFISENMKFASKKLEKTFGLDNGIFNNEQSFQKWKSDILNEMEEIAKLNNS